MLKVEHLTVKAGTFLVSYVSLNVRPGTCHVILGPTGSGKTVLLEALIGLRNPIGGRIWVEGCDVTSRPIEERGFGYVPQDLALFPHMTVRKNILYAQRVRKNVRSNADLFDSIVGSLGINGLMQRGISSLSGGERQRVALARAIVSGARVLILDEPLSSLHEGLRRELWFVLKDLAQSYNIAFLIVTHDLEEAFFLADEITILLDGKVCHQGSATALAENPQTIQVARFMGIRNLFTINEISVDRTNIWGHSTDLGGKLSVAINACVTIESHLQGLNGKCVVGIRSKDVVLYGTSAPANECNLFTGTIKAIYQGGNVATIVTQTSPDGITVECSLPLSDAASVATVVGKPIYFGLPPEKLFILKDT